MTTTAPEPPRRWDTQIALLTTVRVADRAERTIAIVTRRPAGIDD
jgi:hypothetical protein